MPFKTLVLGIHKGVRTLMGNNRGLASVEVYVVMFILLLINLILAYFLTGLFRTILLGSALFMILCLVVAKIIDLLEHDLDRDRKRKKHKKKKNLGTDSVPKDLNNK